MEEKIITKWGSFDKLLSAKWGKLCTEMKNDCQNKHDCTFNKTL